MILQNCYNIVLISCFLIHNVKKNAFLYRVWHNDCLNICLGTTSRFVLKTLFDRQNFIKGTDVLKSKLFNKKY